jgi:hypothetical protein
MDNIYIVASEQATPHLPSFWRFVPRNEVDESAFPGRPAAWVSDEIDSFDLAEAVPLNNRTYFFLTSSSIQTWDTDTRLCRLRPQIHSEYKGVSACWVNFFCPGAASYYPMAT